MSYQITDKSLLALFDEWQESSTLPHIRLAQIIFELKTVEYLFDFKGGRSDYTKAYYQTAAAKTGALYPLMTGSLLPVGDVAPIRESDVIRGCCLSYNKDNDSGSVAFYHEAPFIVGGHHYALIPRNPSELSLQYAFHVLNEHFARTPYFQSKQPVANKGVIGAVALAVPVAGQGLTSHQLQETIAAFYGWYKTKIEAVTAFANGLKQHSSELDSALLRQMFDERALAVATPASEIARAFDAWAASTGLELEFNQIQFDTVKPFPAKGSQSVYFDISTPQLAKNQSELVSVAGGIPVYTAATAPVAHIEAAPAIAPKLLAASTAAPVVSFAADGTNAGDNWVLHTQPFFVNASRKALRFTELASPEYFYFALQGMKAKYNLDWGNKASTERLAGLVEVPMPRAGQGLTSVEIQAILARFLKHRLDHWKELRAKAEELRAKAEELRAAFMVALTGGGV